MKEKKNYKLKEKKVTNQVKRKKTPISTQGFKLFRDGKKLQRLQLILEIPAKRALKLWSQFLRLEKMYECYEFYQIFQFQILELLSICNFIRKNEGDIRNIANVLKEAKDVYYSHSYRAQIKNEIERLKQMNNNYLQNQNTNYQQPVPLGPYQNIIIGNY